MTMTDFNMAEFAENNLEKMAKGWSKAMECSEEKLRVVRGLEGEALAQAIGQGQLILETVCLFTHACVKSNQFRSVIYQKFV
jgi:hypothetical protein